MTMSFLVPNTVSQDLLLIQDLIGVPEPLPPKPLPLIQDDIDSSGSENGSEDEIEADLVKVENEEKKLELSMQRYCIHTSLSNVYKTTLHLRIYPLALIPTPIPTRQIQKVNNPQNQISRISTSRTTRNLAALLLLQPIFKPKTNSLRQT